jgi:polysaccharide chain length determinant protein (PEP-CTERM system associated)
MNQKPVTPEDPFAIVKQSIEVLRKHKHAVFLSSLLLAIAGIIGVSLIPNKYQATTTILVDPQKIPERYVASTVTSDPNAHLNTLTQQVLSASRLQEIIDQTNPYPELRKKKSREELIDYIRSKIKIELKPGSEQALSSFSISYTDGNRWLVAPVANQLASSFIDWNLKARQQQAVVTTQFLSNELQQAQKSLEEQESALQAFRLQHAGATPDQLNANLQALSRLQADVQSNMDAISRLDEERILMTQQAPAESHDSGPQGERGRLIQERNRLETELQTLRRQFTDTYPDVVSAKAQLENVTSRLNALPPPPQPSAATYDTATRLRAELINKDIERHKEQIASLQRQIGGYQGKVQEVPILETQLAELTRNYETSRQNYQSLLDKRLSAGMSEDLERRQQAERFTVLDPARTPEKPFQPKRLPFMAGAVVLAILLSVITTIVLSLQNGAVSSEADLTAMLPPKLKILATIPPIESAADLRHARIITLRTAFASLLACAVLILFLLKVRPIL